jgi:tRNA wybutosine-synthesizing protein 1
MKKPFFRPWENITNENNKLRLPERTIQNLEKAKYKVFGHSAVQICGWTKKSLNNEGVCYKQKFYGISTSSCCEFSPSVMWCQENCSFCWRPMEWMKNLEIDKSKVDEPEILIKEILKKRELLLSGFNKNHGVNVEKLKKSFKPKHYAISLSGEPTMYPKLNELVKIIKSFKETQSIFVVTNAQIPEYFEKLKTDLKALPTQLYISLQSPNKELFQKVNRPMFDDGFEKLKKSLKIFKDLKTRRILRFTQIKGTNDTEELLENYKELIELSNPDFIEIKAYMHIGKSQDRHKKEEMPTFLEVISFAKKITKVVKNFEYIDVAINSRIALLRNKNSIYKSQIEKWEN